MPNTDVEGAEVIAEACRKSVEDLAIVHGASRLVPLSLLAWGSRVAVKHSVVQRQIYLPKQTVPFTKQSS